MALAPLGGLWARGNAGFTSDNTAPTWSTTITTTSVVTLTTLKTTTDTITDTTTDVTTDVIKSIVTKSIPITISLTTTVESVVPHTVTKLSKCLHRSSSITHHPSNFDLAGTITDTVTDTVSPKITVTVTNIRTITKLTASTCTSSTCAGPTSTIYSADVYEYNPDPGVPPLATHYVSVDSYSSTSLVSIFCNTEVFREYFRPSIFNCGCSIGPIQTLNSVCDIVVGPIFTTGCGEKGGIFV